jgi:hypothetical protein
MASAVQHKEVAVARHRELFDFLVFDGGKTETYPSPGPKRPQHVPVGTQCTDPLRLATAASNGVTDDDLTRSFL